MNYPNFEEAKRELLEFLKENPEMISYQKQIENHVLAKAGKDPLLRMKVLSELMVDSLNQLLVELQLLNFKIISLTKEDQTRH